MSAKSQKKLEEIAERRALTPAQQRRLWARALACRHVLIKHGLITTDEFRALEDGIVADIKKQTADNLKQTVGAEE